MSFLHFELLKDGFIRNMALPHWARVWFCSFLAMARRLAIMAGVGCGFFAGLSDFKHFLLKVVLK